MLIYLGYTYAFTGVYHTLEFDAVMSMSHNVSATSSKHPIERGSSITDHVTSEPLTISLSGLITNSPVNQVTLDGERFGPIHGTRRETAYSVRTQGFAKSFQVEGGLPFGVIPNSVPVLAGASVPFNGFTRPVTQTKVTPAVFEPGYSFGLMDALTFDTPMDRVKEVYVRLEAICLMGQPLEVFTPFGMYNMLLNSVNAPMDGTDSMTFELSLTEFKTVTLKQTLVNRTSKPKPAPEQKRAEDPAGLGASGEPVVIKRKSDVLNTLF